MLYSWQSFQSELGEWEAAARCETSQFVMIAMAKSKEEKIRHAIAELVEKGNLGIVEETFAADYVAHAGEKEYRGPAFIKRFAKQLRTAIPDMRVVEVKFFASERVAFQETSVDIRLQLS